MAKRRGQERGIKRMTAEHPRNRMVIQSLLNRGFNLESLAKNQVIGIYLTTGLQETARQMLEEKQSKNYGDLDEKETTEKTE
jgi:hypothetical protein